MGIDMWLAMHKPDAIETTRAELNKLLAVGGLSVSLDDARMLAAGRDEALAELERVEFGAPAIVGIAGAVATSPHLTQSNVAEVLFELQRAFYAIRDELPVDVPDAEIAEALRGCLDEWGDAASVASMPPDEVMGFSAEYVRATETESVGEYRIIDDDGRAYVFNPSEWDYDEFADGWDGERWFDDWGD